jgi:hypothetical protein
VGEDGGTTIRIDRVAWGTEVLVARWFYWGLPWLEKRSGLV